MDLDLVITLLTVTVVLLSIVIIALLAAVTLVIIKVNNIAKSVDQITNNFASATAWLSPAKLVSEIVKVFRRK